jgi:hypothetical protein
MITKSGGTKYHGSAWYYLNYARKRDSAHRWREYARIGRTVGLSPLQ